MAISSQAPQECGEGSTTRADGPERTMEPHERAGSKFCRYCSTDKPLNQWYPGTGGRCKECDKKRMADYYSRAKAKVLARQAEYSKVHALDKRARANKWIRENRVRRREIMTAYYESKMQRMPRWDDRVAIELFYSEAERLSNETAIPHEVDHIF